MGIIYWIGYCDKERVEALTDLEMMVKSCALLKDFKSFSGISVSLTIEIQECKIDALYQQMKDYMKMDEVDQLNSDLEVERVVLLNVTYSDIITSRI